MNKQNEYVKTEWYVWRGVERELRKKKYEFQMGFQPTTFRTIGPRNIYIFKYSISILLLLEMYGRTIKFSLVDFPCFDIPPKLESPDWPRRLGY